MQHAVLESGSRWSIAQLPPQVDPTDSPTPTSTPRSIRGAKASVETNVPAAISVAGREWRHRRAPAASWISGPTAVMTIAASTAVGRSASRKTSGEQEQHDTPGDRAAPGRPRAELPVQRAARERAADRHAAAEPGGDVGRALGDELAVGVPGEPVRPAKLRAIEAGSAKPTTAMIAAGDDQRRRRRPRAGRARAAGTPDVDLARPAARRSRRGRSHAVAPTTAIEHAGEQRVQPAPAEHRHGDEHAERDRGERPGAGMHERPGGAGEDVVVQPRRPERGRELRGRDVERRGRHEADQHRPRQEVGEHAAARQPDRRARTTPTSRASSSAELDVARRCPARRRRSGRRRSGWP